MVALQAGYYALLPKLNRILSQYDALHQELERILALVNDAPAEIAKVRDILRLADQEIAKLQETEFFIDEAMSLYQKADTVLKTAETLLSEKRFVGMRKELDESAKLAGRATDLAKRLPQERKRLLDSIKPLEDTAKEVNALREQAHEAFGRMEKQFAESSWSSIARNGSEADRHIAEAKQGLVALPDLLSMKSQKWDEAEKARAFAERALQEARSLLEAVLHQERSINSSKEKTAEELEAARADLIKAKDFLTRYGSPTKKELIDALEKAKALLAEAETESQKKRPDFLWVIKKALEANAAADMVFAKANSQKEEKERKIRLSNTAVAEAEDAIASAQNYLLLHMGDLRINVFSLTLAERELSTAHNADNVDAKIRHATRSQDLAEDVLSLATSEVAAAENERRRLREAEEAREALAARERERQQAASKVSRSRRFESSNDSPKLSLPSFPSRNSGNGGGGSSSFGAFGKGGGGSSGW